MNNRFLKTKKLTQAGQALLLSLLILAGVSAAGIGFATLIINLIQGAGSIDNSLTAFYAAESSMEQALHQVKEGRRNNDSLTDTISTIAALEKNLTFSGATAKVSEADSQEAKNTFFLAKDESQQIDLYNPDDPFGTSLGITDLWISWDNNPLPFSDPGYSNGYGTGNEWVEISWTGWDQNGNSYENVEKILLSSLDLDFDNDPPQGNGTCPEYEGNPCTTIQLDSDPNPPDLIFYQVRVKALYNIIDDLEVKAFNDSDPTNFIDLPSRVYIKALGKFGRSQQALSASMPWRFPVSGIFDYVIFAEKELKKIPGNP